MESDEAHIKKGDQAAMVVSGCVAISVAEDRHPHRAMLHSHGQDEGDLFFLSASSWNDPAILTGLQLYR
jgi:hypothetical protein